MFEYLTNLFSTSTFAPHGFCYLWRPDILWLNVGSDLLIGIAYFTIPVILLYFLRRAKILPYPWVIALFAAFIVLCGVTHFVAIWAVWQPVYMLQGVLKLVTAIVSIITAILLIPLAPKIVALTELKEEVEQQRTVLTLVRSERERLERDLNNFFILSKDMFCVIDDKDCFQCLNPAWEDTFGYTEVEMKTLSLVEFVHKDDKQQALSALQNLRQGERVANFEHRCLDKSGDKKWLQWSAAPMTERGLIYAIARDVTEQKVISNKLDEEKKRLQVTLHSIGDGVITTDSEGKVDYLNPVAEMLTGWSNSEASQRTLCEVFHIIDEHSGQRVFNPAQQCLALDDPINSGDHTILINRSEQNYAVQASAAPIRNSSQQLLGAVIVFRDVTESRELKRELTYHALHDYLTGLYNRRAFEDRLQTVLDNAVHENSTHALCYLDLDKFKIINDTCGHEAGDELIRQIARLFRSKIRKNDFLSRLGGDEFAVLLEYCEFHEAQRIAGDLLDSVRQFEFHCRDKVFRLGVSIGLVPINAASGSCSDILRDADSACYMAKGAGRNRVHIMGELVRLPMAESPFDCPEQLVML